MVFGVCSIIIEKITIIEIIIKKMSDTKDMISMETDQISLKFVNHASHYIKFRNDVKPPLAATDTLNNLLKDKKLAAQETSMIKGPYETEYTVRMVFKKTDESIFGDIPKEYLVKFVRYTVKHPVYFTKDVSNNLQLSLNETTLNDAVKMDCVVRYDYFDDDEKSISFKVRLYHDFHYVDNPYPVTVGVAKEYNVPSVADCSHFDAVSKFANFTYDERNSVTAFFFQVTIDAKDVIFRVAIKEKKRKTFLDIECEEDVDFKINVIIFLCMEYYAWQYKILKQIREPEFGSSSNWMIFIETQFKDVNKTIKEAVDALNTFKIILPKNTSAEELTNADDQMIAITKLLFVL